MYTKTLLFFIGLAIAPLASAGTVIDTTLNVAYTATSTFVADNTNTYDVFLTVDPTGFDAGSGFLTAIAMKFLTGMDTATGVSLLEAPGGPGEWSLETPGGLNAKGCDGLNVDTGNVCFDNISASATVPGGPYYFEFAVTMPGGDALTATSDIRADYSGSLDPTNKNNLGITSQSLKIGSVPEPGSLGLLAGVMIAFLVRLKRPAIRINAASDCGGPDSL